MKALSLLISLFLSVSLTWAGVGDSVGGSKNGRDDRARRLLRSYSSETSWKELDSNPFIRIETQEVYFFAKGHIKPVPFHQVCKDGDKFRTKNRVPVLSLSPVRSRDRDTSNYVDQYLEIPQNYEGFDGKGELVEVSYPSETKAKVYRADDLFSYEFMFEKTYKVDPCTK